ncbi:MAG: tRNA (adenosine(37)-N6)-threonylcarbamoyltransferase complex transferase subunit TsaD [Candidatus Portiera sp.]|nr:tRNA (adenosine(37)-N6)-threonylcarbamoyltransferase complex transferase subunit TsaD [Portiera sp.]
MLIFAVESSCDETAVALYKSGVLAHKVYSQFVIHQKYKGVVPELAARSHIEKLIPLTEECLQEAEVSKKAIDAVAYTMGPGLIPCLMAGAAYARSLAYGLEVPALGIHHLESHILSPLLSDDKPSFPYVTLLVSGGHTQLYEVLDYGDYRLHGQTRDDAAGEAFDKTAVLLGLSYPGGAELEKLAKKGDHSRFSSKHKLTMPMANSGDYDFSFSGIKTQVRYLAAKLDLQNDREVADLAAAFQHTITKGLTDKTLALAQEKGIKNIAIVGGVSANRYFRDMAKAKSSSRGMKVYFAPLEYATDNAAMVALTASYRLSKGQKDNLIIQAKPRLGIPA